MILVNIYIEYGCDLPLLLNFLPCPSMSLIIKKSEVCTFLFVYEKIDVHAHKLSLVLFFHLMKCIFVMYLWVSAHMHTHIHTHI